MVFENILQVFSSAKILDIQEIIEETTVALAGAGRRMSLTFSLTTVPGPQDASVH
jgi:hypothetical protein